MKQAKKRALLVMAGGLGSRYGGNKQVDKIGPDGEILMQYSIYDAIMAGFTKIVFIIKEEHRALLESIAQGFSWSGTQFCFAVQDFSSLPAFYKIPEERIKPFGTVHAVLCAREAVSEPFAVINADDFYGAEAFCTMVQALDSLGQGEAAMVSYKLKNTLSKNGSVARGICQAEDGYLTEVREIYGITLSDNGEIVGDGERLSPSLPVSMNMWGMSPEIFPLMDDCFCRFLRAIPDGEIKAEYILSHFIDDQIKSGALRVKVEATNAEWFGVTYREDRAAVAARLQKLKADGIYPEKLRKN